MKEEKKRLTGYDYTDREAREETAYSLFARAKSARSEVEREWERYNAYYNFEHDVSAEVMDSAEENGLPWRPATMPDPWIIVESQIDPNVPEPEFRGRDGDMDSTKARQREYAVRYICENNRLEDMNTRNERRLLKYGDAFWKAYWDTEMRCGKDEGDIRIKDIPVDAVFPDPSVRDGSIQDGQFIDYVYRIHKVSFLQLYGKALEKEGVDAEEILSSDYKGELFDLTTAVDNTDDTVQILEHWFKHPVEEDGAPAGSVGCSIQAGGHELRYIPNYWKNTCKQNHLFPFVHYWRIQDENRIWNKSELFPIIELIDAADRKLAMGILGDAFMANDIIVVEEGALADGENITNEPGATIKTKPNRGNGVRRLGGIQSLANAAVGLEWFKDQIERTTRNYDTSRGKEAARTNTATGMAMLRADADSQTEIKKADRNKGFERLYELLDWLALEFFDDGRLLFLGADESKDRKPMSFSFDSSSMTVPMPAVLDMNGAEVRAPWEYYPKVDVTITASDSMVKGKQQTLEALQVLTQSNITADNWKLFAAQLEILDVPGKQDIIREWKNKFDIPQGMPQGLPQGLPQGAQGMGDYQTSNPAQRLPGKLNGVPTGI